MFLITFQRASVATLVGGLAFTTIPALSQEGAGKIKESDPNAQVSAPLKPVRNEAKPPQAGAKTAAKVPVARKDDADGLAKLDTLRKELLKAASTEWEQAYKGFVGSSRGTEMERAYQASKRLMHARSAQATGRDAAAAAATEHLNHVREIARVLHSSPTSDELQSAQLRVYAAQAALWLAQVNTPEAGNGESKKSSTESGSKNERGKDPKSQMILAKLEEPISMSFTMDTPLEDVLKYIKQATTTPTYAGIPIYVDPLGLQEVEKSMTSTVRNIDLEGVPLRRTLQLVLKQIDLVYFVEDGLLYITSEDSAEPLRPSMHEPSPILQKAEKAERGELSLAEMKELVETLKVRLQIMDLSSATHADETHETRQSEELKQHREQLNLLLNDIRGLLGIFKEGKQKEKAGTAR